MVKKAIRPTIFKWRQTEPALILCAVRWYLRYSLSFRDVEELLSERGLEADHTTIWRWVQRYGPELEERRAIDHLRIETASSPGGTKTTITRSLPPRSKRRSRRASLRGRNRVHHVYSA